jgi:hypothetical protein
MRSVVRVMRLRRPHRFTVATTVEAISTGECE